MGTADLVPGVSGGTIALVVGVYERLVASIREGSSAIGNLLKWNLDGARKHLQLVEWSFLLPLLGGILLAVALLSSFLEHQLEERPVVLAAAFFGLVAGSVWIAWNLLKNSVAFHSIVAVAVAATLFVLLGFGGGGEVSDPSLLVFFGAGAVAICAMILPGISGSLILVLLGMYGAVLGAVSDRDFTSIGVFTLGAITGLALFSQILHWALKKHHDVVLAGLVGLMAGSLRILWPWPDGVESAELAVPGDDLGLALIAAVLGAVAVYVLAKLAKSREALS
jgi:putative membrane protein